jgi:hypothetical protein
MGFHFRLLGNSAKKPSPVFFTIRPVLANLVINLFLKMRPEGQVRSGYHPIKTLERNFLPPVKR